MFVWQRRRAFQPTTSVKYHHPSSFFLGWTWFVTHIPPSKFPTNNMCIAPPHWCYIDEQGGHESCPFKLTFICKESSWCLRVQYLMSMKKEKIMLINYYYYCYFIFYFIFIFIFFPRLVYVRFWVQQHNNFWMLWIKKYLYVHFQKKFKIHEIGSLYTLCME
jgi:hypothetical protein